MKKHSKILILVGLVVGLASCGGNEDEAGTPPFGTGSTAAGCATSGASAASAPATCVSASSLTLQLDSNSIQNTGVATVKATATAITASGQALSGIPVSFSVDNGATFTQSSSTTSAAGTVVATVSIGSDPSNRLVTVTATSGSLSTSAVFAVTGSTLTATGSAIVAPSSTGNQIIFRLTNANSAGVPNQPISIVAGVLGTTTGATDSNGNYTYTYTAPASAGSIDVVASAGGVSKTLTVLVQSGAGSIPPAVGPINSASVTANPSVVSTNTASTNNSTQIRARFVGPGNAAVQRVRVRFDLNGDPNSIGGSFSTGTSVIYSDVSGDAITAYIPGTKSSPTNGVTIRACYDLNDFAASACPNQAVTTITVVSDPLSVTIGSNAQIVTPSANLTYQRKFVVLVVDAAGRAKANVDIVPSIDIEQYWKGVYDTPGAWTQHLNLGGCANEDGNRNGVLETSEDINHSGAIEPRKSDVAISIEGTGKTDNSGSAVIVIEYPQNVASWARVKILVAATGVSGTEGRATWTEVLPVPAAALTAQSSPPFVVSPYGQTTGSTNLNPASNPTFKFPDGSVIPNATLTPCQNPN